MSALASFLQKFCSSADQPILFLDAELIIIKASPAFCAGIGLTTDQVEGEELFSLPDGVWNGQELRDLIDEQNLQPFGMLASSPLEWGLGSNCRQLFSINAYYIQELSNEDPPQILLAFRQQNASREQQQREAELAKYLSQATTISSNASILELTLEMCLHAITQISGYPIGHAYLVPDSIKEPLVSTDVCRVSQEFEASHLLQEFTELEIFSGDRLPGEVWRSRQSRWVESIEEEPASAWVDATEGMCLKSAFAIPFLVGGRIRAIMEFFDSESKPRSSDIIRFCTQISRRAGRVVERQEMVEQLREAMIASAQASLARSQFLSNMSHELRTPMTAVLGMLELSLQEDLPPPVRDYLRSAEDSATSLLSLLNDILDFAGLESGNLSLVPEQFHLRDLLEQSMSRHAEFAREKNLKLIIKIPSDVPDELSGDPIRIRQIIEHLLENAVKFTEQGQITFQVSVVDQISDEQVVLSFLIDDTGSGFTLDDESILYEGFRQIDASSTRKHSGAGLGLAICSALAERMGGQFSIESTEGEGSRARVIVPFGLFRDEIESPSGETLPDQHENDDRSSRVALAAKPISILLAEDTPANQKVIGTILRKRGHQVTIAANGKEALECFSPDRFDTILMDLQMPLMDGYQSTAAIRELERHSGGHTPIIALTAHSTQSDREACLQAGMDAYLPKPINVAQLIEMTESTAAKASNSSDAAQTRESSATNPPSVDVFDLSATMKRLGGDEDLLREFIEVFNEDAPLLLEELRAGVSGNDSHAVQNSAHSLRGLASNFSAETVVDLASRLEKAGKNDELTGTIEITDQLEQAVQLLQEALSFHVQS